MTELFPGATAVSRLRVYDWPAPDGLRGGSPHLHTASAEGYVVLGGEGTLQTLSAAGYEEHPLRSGTVLWFTPGTVHRLVTAGGDLDVLVVMQNAGLPEAGDAVLTFPPEVLTDPEAYARAAALPPGPGEPPCVDATDGGPLGEAARTRRDLAVAGYLELRSRVLADGAAALDPLYRAAAVLVRDRASRWRDLWRDGALAQAQRTGDQLTALAAGRDDHLHQAAVHVGHQRPAPRAFGMCGRLQTWDLHQS